VKIPYDGQNVLREAKGAIGVGLIVYGKESVEKLRELSSLTRQSYTNFLFEYTEVAS
jgi:hypothetical protein